MRRLFVAVVVIAMAMAAFVYQRDRARRIEHEHREAALKTTLAQLRGSLEHFHRAHGRYPHTLAELGPIPIDPMTNKRDWRVVTEETVRVREDFTSTIEPKPEVFVVEIHSNAPGYSDY